MLPGAGLGGVVGSQVDLIAGQKIAALAGLRRSQRIAQLNRRDAGVQFVPIKQIVASLDRQGDFTRSFLPRAGINADRWVRLYEALSGPEGFPEVELLRVGDRYAVVDGHHRISVARAVGMEDIAAHVVEVVS